MNDGLDLLAELKAIHVRIQAEAIDRVDLGPNPGSAIRGALYGALQRQYCDGRRGAAVHWPDEAAACPVCWLLAIETPNSTRGRNRPRPLTVEPTVSSKTFQPGDQFEFGFGLIGRSIDLWPAIAGSLGQMGDIGLGPGRGRFRPTIICAWNPITGASKTIEAGDSLPFSAAVTNDAVAGKAKTMEPDRLAIRFLTPTRLTEAGRLVRTPDLGVMIRRLVERCEALSNLVSTDVTESAGRWQEVRFTLGSIADAAEIEADSTRWTDAWSGSARTGRRTPTGGFIGEAIWRGDLASLFPWVLWGTSLHVGKNAVKGDGWYQLLD